MTEDAPRPYFEHGGADEIRQSLDAWAQVLHTRALDRAKANSGIDENNTEWFTPTGDEKKEQELYAQIKDLQKRLEHISDEHIEKVTRSAFEHIRRQYESITGLDTQEVPSTAEIQRSLRSWESILKTRLHERAEKGSQMLELDKEIYQWFDAKKGEEKNEHELYAHIRDLQDQLAHGSEAHATQVAQPLFNALRGRYAAMIGLENQAREILATPEEGEELCRIDIGGSKKPSVDKDPQVLGKYGQDVVRANRKKGILVVADGSGSLKESFTVARIASQAAERILGEIPTAITSLPEAVTWVRQHVPDIIRSLDALDDHLKGATTLLASVYMPQFDALIVIDIGDSQYTLTAGTTPVSIQKRKRTIGNFIKRGDGRSELISDGYGPRNPELFVHGISLESIRAQYPGQEICLMQSSDGIQNNTNQPIENFTAQLLTGNTIGMQRDKDDISYGVMHIPNPGQ